MRIPPIGKTRMMTNQEKIKQDHNKPDHFIDITADVCPMTFVKVKLLLEKAGNGDIVDVRLKGAEPLENVPRSAADHGHDIVDMTQENTDGAADGVHQLRIRVVK